MDKLGRYKIRLLGEKSGSAGGRRRAAACAPAGAARLSLAGTFAGIGWQGPQDRALELGYGPTMAGGRGHGLSADGMPVNRPCSGTRGVGGPFSGAPTSGRPRRGRVRPQGARSMRPKARRRRRAPPGAAAARRVPGAGGGIAVKAGPPQRPDRPAGDGGAGSAGQAGRRSPPRAAAAAGGGACHATSCHCAKRSLAGTGGESLA